MLEAGNPIQVWPTPRGILWKASFDEATCSFGTYPFVACWTNSGALLALPLFSYSLNEDCLVHCSSVHRMPLLQCLSVCSDVGAVAVGASHTWSLFRVDYAGPLQVKYSET